MKYEHANGIERMRDVTSRDACVNLRFIALATSFYLSHVALTAPTTPTPD